MIYEIISPQAIAKKRQLVIQGVFIKHSHALLRSDLLCFNRAFVKTIHTILLLFFIL